ncbi:LysR family transcriptional regulator [Actinomadura sp. NBRC 104412]|uniref:LysR family transcriptional regulator n=1 Tax=Actinomadura sp. NBRC 104412 TaxID=3032203 RepID=UPI002553C9FF|nr:LysR family transcriptional regulator [Actinomadura sp. NBRC 104412]
MLRELKLRGTVGAAADALGYSPSAVSQQLAQLQKDAGVELVERVGRRLRLTAAGETLAGHAETLLAQAQRAEEETLAASGRVAGVVRLVGFQTALLHVLAPALPRLAEAYPELVVDVLDEEFHRVLQALVMAEIDVVLTDEYSHLPRPHRPELAAEVLITEPMRLVLAEDDPLAGTGPVSMAALAGRAWATSRAGTNLADLLERTCVELGGFRPQVRYRSNDVLVVLTMVARARAAALLPYLAVAEREVGVVPVDLAEASVERRMVMWTRVGAEVRPSVRAVLDALRASADALAARLPLLVRGVPEGE